MAPTAKLRPDAAATVTFDAGQAPGLLDVTVPGVIEVIVTAYGFGLVKVKNTSPAVKPGYKSAVAVAAVTVIDCAVNALA